MSRRGKFITFEGLDGTGKSTQMRRLAAVLREAGHKVVETREPGGTPTAEKIRRVLLDSGTAGLAPLAEMALMFGARAQHIAEVIEPALEPLLRTCDCGGRFKASAAPRCPHCRSELSASEAKQYLEAAAPGTGKGWRWQETWSGLYCIVIGDKLVNDNWKASP